MFIASSHSFSIGHSTRPIGDFLALLKENGIRELADVRTFPHSKRYPQFDKENLIKSLGEQGIAYGHMRGLGGLRKIPYERHMDTADFKSAFQVLIRKTAAAPTAFMCSEGSPEKCHRRFIADAMEAKGIPVRHILSPGNVLPHRRAERQPEFLL